MTQHLDPTDLLGLWFVVIFLAIITTGWLVWKGLRRLFIARPHRWPTGQGITYWTDLKRVPRDCE